MKSNKIVALGAASLAVVALAACSNRSGNRSEAASDSIRVAYVTDTGGVDDHSFNESAWTGLKAWGEENNLEQNQGYTYYQSENESDFTNNFQQAITEGYDMVAGAGFALATSLEEVAKNNPDTKFVMVDSVIDLDNVASATFADQEAAYLAGVAAAKNTKSKQVGFIGGVESEVITRFEKGFEAGVKSVDPSIKVQVDYAGSFNDAAKGKTIAAAQYAAGADVIFHASGKTGDGLLNEAITRNEKLAADSDEKVWVIGVDSDQAPQGGYKDKDGKESNVVLTSTLKEVGNTIKDMATKLQEDKFPGGTTTAYDLKSGGVEVTYDNLNEETKKAVEEAKQAIIDGKVTVPEK